MTIFQAIIIAIVEGLTEFLPVSSTGHMIITEYFLGIQSSDFTKLFTVNIQFGAILSVVLLYRHRFFQSISFYYKLFAAFIPAAVIGFLLGDYIDGLLENVYVVAWSTLIGGVVLLFVDKWFIKNQGSLQHLKVMSAFKIGLLQCLALIPGVSRSAATVIGGMMEKLTRKDAAEFSFLLAVPTLGAAAGYKLLKTYNKITTTDVSLLILGNIVAFVVALLAVQAFISMLTRYGFKAFGYYRIVLGLVFLILLYFGADLKVH